MPRLVAPRGSDSPGTTIDASLERLREHAEIPEKSPERARDQRGKYIFSRSSL